MDIKSVNNGSCIGRVRNIDVYVFDAERYECESIQEAYSDEFIIVRQPDDNGMYDLVLNGRIEGTVLNDVRINWGREPYMMYSRKYQKPKKPVKREEKEEEVIKDIPVEDQLLALLDETDKMFKNILKEVDNLVSV
jgi:hypothetical protein